MTMLPTPRASILNPRTFFGRTGKETLLYLDQASGSQLAAQSNFGRPDVANGEMLRVDTGTDIVTAIADNDQQIRVVSVLAVNPIELKFGAIKDGTYDVKLTYNNQVITPIVGIPNTVPFKSVAIAVTILTASSSLIASTSREKGEATQSTACNTPPGVIGFTADNICSFGNKSGVWTFWWPCAGEFKINIDSCCKLHDQQLFCARNEADRIRVDFMFSACVATELIRRGEEEMSWWCSWLFLPLLTAFAGVGLSTVFDILFLLYGFTYKGTYLNYDGRNLSSCLCGGSKPTILCNSDPTNPKNYLCLGKTTSCCTRVNGQVIKNDENLACNYQLGKFKKCDCFRCCWRNGVVMYPPGGDARDCCPGTPGDASNPIRCSR